MTQFKKFSIVENLGTIVGLFGCTIGIIEYRQSIDFPCGLTQPLIWIVRIALIILFGFCLNHLFRGKSQWIETFAAIVLVIIFVLIGVNNWLIPPSIEINIPKNADGVYNLEIPYAIKVCNLRQNEHLQIVAKIGDRKTELYKDFPINYLGMTNPIKGKLYLQDTLFKEKELTIRFLLIGGGEKTVASSETRFFHTK